MSFPALYPGSPFLQLQLRLRAALAAQKVTTEPGGRGYRVDGESQRSVTEILDDDTGRWATEEDRERGNAVHAAVAESMLGDDPARPWNGWLESWGQFVVAVGYVPLAVEVVLSGVVGDVAVPGRADSIGTLKRFAGLPWEKMPLVIVDIKTGAHGRKAAQQVSGYAELLAQVLRAYLPSWQPPLLAYVIGLCPDGDFNAVLLRSLRQAQPQDLADFGRRATA